MAPVFKGREFTGVKNINQEHGPWTRESKMGHEKGQCVVYLVFVVNRRSATITFC